MDKQLTEYHNETWLKRKHKTLKLNYSNMSALKLIPKECNSFLEVGCGRGELLFFLKKRKKAVFGVDISSIALKEARIHHLKVKQVDLNERISFKSNSFDCVISIQVMQHILRPLELLKEMKRVSNKFVLINIPNHLYWSFRFKMLFGKFPEVLGENKGHIRVFSYNSVINLIERTGLKIIKVDFTGRKFLSHLFPSLFASGFSLLCIK